MGIFHAGERSEKTGGSPEEISRRKQHADAKRFPFCRADYGNAAIALLILREERLGYSFGIGEDPAAGP